MKHRLYGTWSNMKQRCYNPKREDYQWYGGRGIVVCDRWHNFENFRADMEPSYQPGLWLDRKDPDGPYCKKNCRWLSPSGQQINRRVAGRNASGHKGIFVRDDKYRTGVMIEGKWSWLGTFENLPDAIAARKRAEEKHYVV